MRWFGHVVTRDESDITNKIKQFKVWENAKRERQKTHGRGR